MRAATIRAKGLCARTYRKMSTAPSDFFHNAQTEHCRSMLEAYRAACVRMEAQHNLEEKSSSAPDFGTHFESRLGGDEWSSSRQVFANHQVNLAEVEAIGFDYDYTLVSYTNALQAMIYDKALERLVSAHGYPRRLGTQLMGGYDADFAVRGLTFDSNTGLIVKLTGSFEVSRDHAFCGRERVSRDDLVSLYGQGSRHISKAYMEGHMTGLLDLFSLAETTLLADVIQSLRDTPRVQFSFAAVREDVRAAVNVVHSSGEMHREVMANVDQYIHPSPGLRSMLRSFRDSGKVLFLLSNSGFPFIDRGLDFILGSKWTDLFDATMTAANKPSFYTGATPFRAISRSYRTGEAQESFGPVTMLRRGRAYSRGNLGDLVQMLGLNSKRVLYFGDHLYTDLVEPTKKRGWYTGAIIREIEYEVAQQHRPEYRTLHWRVEMLEEMMRSLQTGYAGDVDTRTLDALETERAEILLTLDRMYHHNFGSVFTSGPRKSLFASSVDRYADVYCSRIENFLSYSPNHRYIPTLGRRNFAHEPPADRTLVRELLGSARQSLT